MSRLERRLKKLEGPSTSKALVTVLMREVRPADDEQALRETAERHYGRSNIEMMVLEADAQNGPEFGSTISRRF